MITGASSRWLQLRTDLRHRSRLRAGPARHFLVHPDQPGDHPLPTVFGGENEGVLCQSLLQRRVPRQLLNVPGQLVNCIRSKQQQAIGRLLDLGNRGARSTARSAAFFDRTAHPNSLTA